MARRFSGRQRAALFAAADGACQECGTELNDGWHADHAIPYADGGETSVENGRALCPRCNLRKGRSSMYNDAFKPRRFQEELKRVVLARVAAGECVTVANVAPASGKTLAWQALVTDMMRRDLIDFAAVYSPRIVLAQQAETTWRTGSEGSEVGDFLLFDQQCRLQRVRHRSNAGPLLPPGVTHEAFASTYSSLVSDPTLHVDWARRKAGRFMLIADEAQFCGAASRDERDDGTRAGYYVEQLAQYARHTLLLTGTPYRADGNKLVLADYTEPDQGSRGKRYLIAHAEARYRDGVGDYLRNFDATFSDCHVKLTGPNDGQSYESELSNPELAHYTESLKPILKRSDVWQPVVDNVVTRLRAVQRTNSEYRALISCMEQQDAGRVATYLRQRYPDLRVEKATTEDGPAAEDALRRFRAQPCDVLVTVRKAFIGYDCPRITVVGVLTNYRDKGHLMQLIGRGLRVWKESESGQPARFQKCHVFTVDDPKMAEFIEYLKHERDEGLADKDGKDGPGSDSGPGADDIPGWVVDEAYVTDTRSESNEGSVDAEEHHLYEMALHQYGGVISTPEQVRELLELFNVKPDATHRPTPPRRQETPKTEAEIVAERKARAAQVITDYLKREGWFGKTPGYGRKRAKLTAHVNDKFHIGSTDEITTRERADAYLAHVRRLLNRATA